VPTWVAVAIVIAVALVLGAAILALCLAYIVKKGVEGGGPEASELEERVAALERRVAQLEQETAAEATSPSGAQERAAN